MPFEYVSTRREHIEGIAAQPYQVEDKKHFLSMDWEWLQDNGFGITAMRDGFPIAAAGVNMIGEGIGEGWMFIGDQVGPKEMVVIGRNVKMMIDTELKTSLKEIRAYVDEKFDNGHRFAAILGMKMVDYMVDFPDPGRNHIVYARRA